MKDYLFTSESVTEGHPDKVCDQISDAVLDAYLSKDKQSRVACEVACTSGVVFIMGEITSQGIVDVPAVARKVIKDIGYTGSTFGFDADTCAILTSIDKQSSDIAMGVDEKKDETTQKDIGAGDQGMMFGYACKETDEYMPLPIVLAHKLCLRLTKLRKNGTLPYLGPDGKSQVTVKYVDGKPSYIDTIVVSNQHRADVTLEQLNKDIRELVINPVIPEELLNKETKYYVNPTGRFVLGGPQADSGLTGRKIIVDTYGGYARHGGGAFSGKDPTKVDRSAAYAARWIAKNIVAADLADKCEVQLAYSIGVSKPVSIMIDTFGTEKIAHERIEDAVEAVFDLKPSSIIEHFGLRRPIYQQTASYGHFGRNDLELPWEKLDMVEKINVFLKKEC